MAKKIYLLLTAAVMISTKGNLIDFFLFLFYFTYIRRYMCERVYMEIFMLTTVQMCNFVLIVVLTEVQAFYHFNNTRIYGMNVYVSAMVSAPHLYWFYVMI